MPGLIRDAEHQALPPGTLKNNFPAGAYGANALVAKAAPLWYKSALTVVNGWLLVPKSSGATPNCGAGVPRKAGRVIPSPLPPSEPPDGPCTGPASKARTVACIESGGKVLFGSGMALAFT